MFNIGEIQAIFTWWATFFVIGTIFLPLTTYIFKDFYDRGYLFSKVIGLGLVSYLILVLNVLHVLSFNVFSLIFILWIFLILNIFIFRKYIKNLNVSIKIFVLEELIFFVGICIWSFIRAHEPSINGLEKFMDYGFLNSILRTTYQPAVDMWLPPHPINYYYFGHLSTAVITKLSFIQSSITYNLMIATLFSFCFSLTFSIGMNLIKRTALSTRAVIGGLLTGLLVALSGNLHTIYAFFKSYNVDNPVPFWQLPQLINSYPNDYWYPNATRFIPFTIHEFPLYSFVVSDLHGHVADIIYVLLAIAVIFTFYISKEINKFILIFISLILAILYMTNVWDAIIYFLLASVVIVVKNWSKHKIFKKTLTESVIQTALVLFLFFAFSLPFNFFFKPFASGIGVLCAPSILTNFGKIGPLIFEQDHCQKSTWWQLLILYGFFYFFVLCFLTLLASTKRKIKKIPEDSYILILIFIATLLIIIPELVYIKDIYPAHYRANTMFKLVYQSFIILSIASGYATVRIISSTKHTIYGKIFLLLSILLIGQVLTYPYFAIKSYYGELKKYSGLDGLTYLSTKYPEDYEGINWLNKNITGRPVIVEAQGDSYTDFARISANTGLPTILGWTVHEWLWRGSYDIPAPRIKDVQDIYENSDIALTKKLLQKYNAKYIYVGALEYQKYPNLQESKFQKIGNIVWQNQNTKIYKINLSRT